LSEKNKQTKPFYLSYFEKLYESWEISAEKALTLWFHNPLFSNFMDRAVEKSLEFKNYTQEIIDKTLRYRFFPIDNDLAKLTDSIGNFDERPSRLEGKIIKAKNTNIKKKGKAKRRRNRK
jgi:hypothetical protein